MYKINEKIVISSQYYYIIKLTRRAMKIKYLDTIKFPSYEEIDRYSIATGYALYPFILFFKNGFELLILDNITILYGNNGSGKSTVLNLVAEKINAHRNNELFKDVIYDDYECKEIHPWEDFISKMEVKMVIDDSNNVLHMPSIKKLITSNDIL